MLIEIIELTYFIYENTDKGNIQIQMCAEEPS